MKLSGLHSYLSIRTFEEIELADLSFIVGLNGAGKTHFLQAIAEGAIHCDVLGDKPPKEGAPPHGNTVAGISLLRNDDPPPEGLTSGLQTDVRQLFQPSPQPHGPGTRSPSLATIRARLLLPFQERLEEALGASLSAIDEKPADVFKLPLADLIFAAKEKGLTPDETKLNDIFRDADHGFEQASTHRSEGQIRSLRRLSTNIGLPIIALGDEDVNSAGSWGAYDLFQTNFVRVFSSYRDKKLLNAFRKAAGGDQEKLWLSDKNFERQWGGAPWDKVSEALAAFGMPYRVKEPSTDPSRPVQFELERSDGIPVGYSNLSSGEKVLIRFALSSFQVDESRVNVTLPKLLLLDEVDASLHPENVHRLLHAIQTGFIEAMDVRVIMSTHSPTTVALAPDGAIFEMTEDDRIPRAITKQQALNRLTVGLPMLSIDYSGRRQVFVESSVDATHYDRLANLLKAELDLPRALTFISAGGAEGGDSRGGCTIVTRIVKELVSSGVQSLSGIVDWDGKNDPDGPIKVLAHKTHYTKENVLLDPLLVAILLLLDKPDGVVFPMSLPQLEKADPAELQQLANLVIDKLALPGQGASNHYLGGFSLTVPERYQRMKGHDLEAKLIAAFPSLNRYSGSGKWLSDPITGRVLTDFPRFCPRPIADLFREIATEMPNGDSASNLSTHPSK